MSRTAVETSDIRARPSWMIRWDEVAARLLSEHSRTCVALAILLAGVVGVAASGLGHSAFPRDLVEGFLWGRSLELGYHKHPPLQAWVLGALERLVSDQWRWLALAIAQGCVAATIVPVWLLSRRFLGPMLGALSAIMTLAGIQYYTGPTNTLTPDTLSLPLWTWGLYFYWRAVGEGRSEHWFGLALVAVGFVYAKYTGLLLMGVLGALTLATAEGRDALRKPAPWLAMALAALLCLPHLWWLATSSGGSPLSYPLDRTPAQGVLDRIGFTLKFLVNQLLAHTGLLVLLLILAVRLPFRPTAETQVRRDEIPPFARKFLLAVIVAPLGVTLALCLAAGVDFRGAWASPYFGVSALGTLILFGQTARLKNLSTVLIVAAFAIVLQHLGAGLGVYWLRGWQPFTYPAKAPAFELTERFRAQTGAPLRIVVGERWNGGNVAFYSPDRPRLLFDGVFSVSPGVRPEDIAAHGALLVWIADRGEQMPQAVGGVFAGRQAQGVVEYPWRNAYGSPMLRLHYAIVPPGSPLPLDPAPARSGRRPGL